jgi:LPXTG-site transpeptidase (sortase) family protein
MTNVTFSDNRANQHGGALYYRNDNDALLNNVTIASNQADANKNSAGDGGGIFVDDMGTGRILTVRNAIIALNSDPSGGAPDCSGDLQANYSLIGNTTGCVLLAGSGNNLIGSNPNLGPLANNGGPTQTRALLAGSPAIDAADPASGGPGACFSTDQRGVARFDGNYDSIVRCDMGAYEFNQPAPSTLPSTGFPMGRVTNLPPQPAEKTYAAYDDLTLEIPSLGVKAPIVGVPKSEGGWDVSWLGNSVGWLEGSAFPTWPGNTVLTGHVWDADNTPGIFASIKTLKYGDRFTIRAFGQTYVYEVRENTWVWGGSGISKVFKHEEYDWVTLLSCEGYNPLTGKYLFRRMVRAVLVEVK